MGFSYTPGSKAPLDVLRTLIRDVKSDRPIFQDEELDVFLNIEGDGTDVLTAAGYTLAAMATDKARLAIVAHDGNESDLGAIAIRLEKQAAMYFERATAGTGFAVVEMPGPFTVLPGSDEPDV